MFLLMMCTFKAHLPTSGGNNRSREAIEKTLKSAKGAFEMKFPSVPMTASDKRMTCPLEIKYPIFLRKDRIVRSSKLENAEVGLFCLLFSHYILYLDS